MDKKERVKKAVQVTAQKTPKIVNKLIIAGLALVFISYIGNLSKSDTKTEFEFYERNPKTKKTEFLKLKTTKIVKPRKNVNLLSLDYDAQGNKGITYQRNIGGLLFFDTYGGLGYKNMQDGSHSVSLSITLGF